MGGSLATQLLNFAEKEEYTRWTLDNVATSLKRWRSLPVKNGLQINRREFWEIFTVYEVLNEGAFLSLPMRQFELYDQPPRNSVFVYEVFIVLVLCCRGNLEDKLKFCFQLFDTSQQAYLLQPDMVLLIGSCLCACCKLHITTVQPTVAQIESLAKDLFQSADGNFDGRVEETEFMLWASPLMESYAFLRPYGLSPPAPRPPSPHASPPKPGIRPGRRLSTVSASDSSTTPRRASIAAGASPAQPETTDGADPSAPDLVAVASIMARTRAMKLRAVATKRLMDELIKTTRFSRTELLELANAFADTSHSCLALDQDTLLVALRRHVPNLAASPLSKNLLKVMDHNGDGKIDFREFAMGISTAMRGTLHDKVQFMFSMIDVNGDGSVSALELVPVLRQASKELRSVIDFAEEVMMSLDINGDGTVTKDEFLSALAKDATLAETFLDSVTVSTRVFAVLREFLWTHPRVTLPALRQVIARMAERPQELHHRCTFEDFEAFISQNFDAPVEHATRRRVAYDTINQDVSGAITIRDVLHALVQVLGASREQHAELYFSLCDADGSGSLDKGEMLTMIVAARSRLDDGAKELSTILSQLDVDGDGCITCDEFLARAKRSPILMDVLCTMFGAERGSIERVVFGTRVGTETVERRASMAFVDIEHMAPEASRGHNETTLPEVAAAGKPEAEEPTSPIEMPVFDGVPPSRPTRPAGIRRAVWNAVAAVARGMPADQPATARPQVKRPGRANANPRMMFVPRTLQAGHPTPRRPAQPKPPVRNNQIKS